MGDVTALQPDERVRRHRNGHLLELQETDWRCLHCRHWFDATSDADAFWCGDPCNHAPAPVVAPSAAPPHLLTEYGTTRCPVERVAANADDEDGVLICSACGGVVTPTAEATQVDGTAAPLLDDGAATTGAPTNPRSDS